MTTGTSSAHKQLSRSPQSPTVQRANTVVAPPSTATPGAWAPSHTLRRPVTADDDVDAFFAELRHRAEFELPALPEVDLVHGGLVDTEGDAASVPQTEAMVLSLEDPCDSSAAVLTLELDRMDVEELEALEAQLDAASIARQGAPVGGLS